MYQTYKCDKISATRPVFQQNSILYEALMECWLRLLHSLEEVLKVTNINPVNRTELESHNLETFSSTLPQAMTRICSHSHYTIALVDQLCVDIHIPE